MKNNAKLGEGPISPELREKMNLLAALLDKTFNGDAPRKREVGFVLLSFKFNDTSGRCNFISNGADRKDLVAMFKELIARFDGQPELRGNA